MRLRFPQKGLTSVEYAVAGGIIIVGVVAALTGFGPVLLDAYKAIVAAF